MSVHWWVGSCVCVIFSLPSSLSLPPTPSRADLHVVGARRADLHVVGAHLMGKDDLVVDVTVRHDFIGDARDVLRHGTLRNPHRPHQLLDQAAADKIRNYREPYARSVAAVSACVHACLPRGAFTASFCGCSTSLRPGKHLTT